MTVSQIIRLRIKPDMQPAFEALVSQLMQDVVTHEPGAVYDVRRVRGQALTYLYYLSFPDQAAFDRYMEADYHTRMSPKAVAMLDGDPVFEDLEAF
ncbi:MAG: putative quinol monooxygenase [Pseudomonadales bacterium]